MLRTIARLLLVPFAVLALTAQALDLDQAKAQGLVGEQRNGYLGAVSAAPGAAVRELVRSINQARRAEYQRIARRNGLQLDQVEKLAAEKAINKTRPGHFVESAQGGWTKK